MNAPANVNLDIKLRGKFIIEHLRHGEKIAEYESHNKVVNQGLDWIGSGSPGSNAWAGLAVGTGNSTPAAGDTVLANPLAYTTSVSGPTESFVTTAPYSATFSYTYTFAVGAVVGNVAELGIILSTASGAASPIYSRALIMVGGSPGTITVLATDQLIVTYQHSSDFASETSGSFSLNTDGTITTINWQCLPWGLTTNVDGYNASVSLKENRDGFGTFSDVRNESSFEPVTSGNLATIGYSWTRGTYTSGTYNVNCTGSLPTNHGNTFQLVIFATNLMCFQFLLNTPITLLATQTWTMTVNVVWSSAS
jgi:hypothetical protein